MLADHVYCGGCGKEMYTNIGAEVCPFCGEYGMLQYVDASEPEVELQHEPENRKWVGVVEHGVMMEYAIGNTEEEAVQEAVYLAEDDEVTGYYVEEIYYEEV